MDTAPQWGESTRAANLSIDNIGVLECSITITITIEPTFIFTPNKVMDSVIYSHFRAIKHTVLCHKQPHWKELEVNLTQNGLPQFQDLYCLPLLPLLARCRVTAFVYSKFQYGMNKSTQILPKR